MTVEQSALIVPVPETEPVVGVCRAELDRHAEWGVPAHVTVLYPFLSPELIGPAELQRLTEVVRTVRCFEVTFGQVRWFSGDVAWLDPEPGNGFRALTNGVCAAFPGCLPYGGKFGGATPHLTLAAHGEPDRMRAAARDVAAHLPVSAAIRSVHLFKGSDAPGTWHSVEEFPLGAQ